MLGRFAGVELVTDKKAKTSPRAAELGLPTHLARSPIATAFFRAFGDGIVGFAPPLCITEDEVDLMLERFVKSLDELLAIKAIRDAAAG